jgi:hypothetical protein
MTTPDERARAIRWGLDDLLKIQDDPLIAEEVKQKAANVYRSYPDEAMLESWIKSEVVKLDAETNEALLQARQIFESIRNADEFGGTPELRRSLLFTLRHFPMPYELGTDKQTSLPIYSMRLR